MADAGQHPLWTADELVAATKGRLTSPVTRAMHDVSIDTRTLREGDIFVAIKGEKMDGHDFAAAALKAGAGVAMVSRTTPVAGLVAEILALATTAPVESETAPISSPVETWA